MNIVGSFSYVQLYMSHLIGSIYGVFSTVSNVGSSKDQRSLISWGRCTANSSH